ncbi:MAG: UDP-3-O-(3-hydroxymyristoyl)glucosamine N-acyltransferase [Gemmatimonadaceae bacterium]|nr:UDP-3-O-(3-hydroxymyristoyl)glucosamine N-acyltransferase [Gemmatimonadaceae bacterium]
MAPAFVDGGDGPRPITAAAVAAQIGGRLIGDPNVVVYGVAPLDRAESGDLSFLAHARYASWFEHTRAGIVLISPALADLPGVPGARIVVEKPTDAMVSLLARFHRGEPRLAGIHPTAVVAASARVADGVTIDAHAVVQDGAVIGANSWIGATAVIGAGCTLGRDVRVHPGAVLYPYVDVGDRVVLHAGSRVGREGFGFIPGATGPVRIPHVGRCVLEADVEIGANSCVDRGSVDDTIIGAGTKIDNLVQVAHNVRIGRMCFLASQVGLSGSTRIEDGVQIGGQVGTRGHQTIGTGATIAARSGVFGDVPAGELWSGYPARPHKEQMRSLAALARLAKIMRPLEKLLEREDVR